VTSAENHTAPCSPFVEYQTSTEITQNASPSDNRELEQQTGTSFAQDK
jgi:hypothetical protein